MISVINTRTSTAGDMTTNSAFRKLYYIAITIAKCNPLFPFAACILRFMAYFADPATNSGIARIEIVMWHGCGYSGEGYEKDKGRSHFVILK